MNNIHDTTVDMTNGNEQGLHNTTFEEIHEPTPSESGTATTAFQMPSTRINQNYVIVWLDNIFTEVNNSDCFNIVTKLREIVNSVQIFIDVDACIDFISNTEDEKIFLISSGLFGQTVVPIVHSMQQLQSVYIFSGQTTVHEQWINEWKKIKGVFTNIDSICEAVQQSADICDQNYLTISFIKTADDVRNKNFEQLKDTQGGLIIFNNFMMTTLDRASSLAFVQQNQDNSSVIGVVFEISIDLSTSSTAFAMIREASYYQNEEQLLFALHSTFRLGQIKPIDETNNRLWQINLTLVDNNQVQLQNLAKIIRKETYSSHNGWYRLGNFMLKLGRFDEAEQIFTHMLEETDSQGEKAELYHTLGLVNHNQKVSHLTLPPNHPYFAPLYGHMGMVYAHIGDNSTALGYYEQALELSQQSLPSNHPHLKLYKDGIDYIKTNL
ncbi:hypothetical protein I4U23_020096 [Adineta vaga]|nr:hypothetical protein I4U23_020096 [Adineta vaga]